VHNVTSYDGLVTDQVLRSRGVYSSVDIPKGTAISFVPAARIMHRSEFNRSKIWTSLARLSPDPTNHTRTVDLSVGEQFFSCHANVAATFDSCDVSQLLHMSSIILAHIGCPICRLPVLFSVSSFPNRCLS
jgi:hypothetical protein